MCGIIGAFNKENAFHIVQKGLSIMQERGRDGSGYFDGALHYASTPGKLPQSEKGNILGHNLHAIVNTVPQPIEHGTAVLVSNCEIYNWEDLATKYNITAKNDTDLLCQLLTKIGIDKTLQEIRGVYAFAYWDDDRVYIARDIIGIKPLWYSHEGKSLVLASEKKAIPHTIVRELNPRTLITYNLSTGQLTETNREFFTHTNEITSEDEAVAQLRHVLVDAVRIRVPQQKFGVLFSGGIDSSLIAKILKDLGHDVTCYTAGTSENTHDILAAKESAELLGVKLKYKIVPKEEIEAYLRKIVPLIEDSNVVKVGVALPWYVACELAREDGNKVIFAGSGSDELFGGYHRYQKDLAKLNTDIYSDILKFYERNTYRDDVITMNNNLELRVPFLDKNVVAYALRIAPELKINKGTEKYIIRKVAESLGVPQEITTRRKKAAQYGSGFDGMIEKLAGKKTKSEYLKQFYMQKNVKLAALISGGKDSWFAAYTMHRQNYEIACLVTMKSKNKDSFMFHTPNIHMVGVQSQASGIPLIEQETDGEKEHELQDLDAAMQRAKDEFGVEGVVCGALYSNYQRERVEKVADKLGLKIFAPLWHIDQEYELRELLRQGFSIMLSSIAAEGLDQSWLGRELTEKDVDTLVSLNKRIGLNISFEGGEAESLVLDCPLFKKKIRIENATTSIENAHTGTIHVTKASLGKN